MDWEIVQTGRVEGLFLQPPLTTESVAVPQLIVEVAGGVRGDRHYGGRLSDAREVVLKKAGIGKEVDIANMREFSAVSVEEVAEIGRRMLPAGMPLDPILLDPNLLISGIDGLSQIPPGSYLTFGGHKAVLGVWAENNPCQIPHDKIAASLPQGVRPHSAFGQAGRGKRGIVGFVYCSGKVKVGDEVSVWQMVARE